MSTPRPPDEPPPPEWPAETEVTAVAPAGPPPPVVPPGEDEPGNRIGLGMLLAIVFLAAIAAVIAAILLTRHHHKSAPTTTVVTTTAQTTTAATTTAKLTLAVPDLVGQQLKDASKGLQDAGFHVTLVTVPSALPAGTVVAQDPAGGVKVARGSDVRLNVSSGSKTKGTTTTATTPTTTAGTTTQAAPTTTAAATPTSTSVPSLSGDIQPALQELDTAGFVASIAYVPGQDPLGTVVSQAPAGGATANTGSEVTVNVSAGPNGDPSSQTVPDVKGKKIPEAVATFHQAGLRLVFLRMKVSDKSQAGMVVAQTPEAGKHAPKNAQVLVYMGAYQP